MNFLKWLLYILPGWQQVHINIFNNIRTEGPHTDIKTSVHTCVCSCLNISVCVCVSRQQVVCVHGGHWSGGWGGQVSGVHSSSRDGGIVRFACEIGDDACWQSCRLKSIPASFFFLSVSLHSTHTNTHTESCWHRRQLAVSLRWGSKLSSLLQQSQDG